MRHREARLRLHPRDISFVTGTDPDIYGTFSALLDTLPLPKGANCNEMFITQPPVKQAKLTLIFTERSTHTGLQATLFRDATTHEARAAQTEQTVQDAEGVKFGTIIKAREAMLEQYDFDGSISKKTYIEIDGVAWATEEQIALTKKVEIMHQWECHEVGND